MSNPGSITGGLSAARHAARLAVRHLAGLLLPQHCFLCGDGGSDAPLCPACRADLPRLATERCPVCALPTPGGDICGACLKHPPHFDATEAVFRYDFPVDHLVQALKYQHRLVLAEIFAEQMAAGPWADGDVLVPLPLSPRRLRERGFNQAAEIARALGRRCGLPVLADACQRTVDTPPQAMLPWQARRKNVRGAFECRVDLANRDVVVIDDVMTTGATVDEFARTLKKHGARRVANWVVARTLKE